MDILMRQISNEQYEINLKESLFFNKFAYTLFYELKILH